jgi:hypothetical protein
MPQPRWLKPFNRGRKPGSKNRPKPCLLRRFAPTLEDEALLSEPISLAEEAELACHLLDIRRRRRRAFRAAAV